MTDRSQSVRSLSRTFYERITREGCLRRYPLFGSPAATKEGQKPVVMKKSRSSGFIRQHLRETLRSGPRNVLRATQSDAR